MHKHPEPWAVTHTTTTGQSWPSRHPVQGGLSVKEIKLMEPIRCRDCHALLFKTAKNAISGIIEIKCRRCGTLNQLRPKPPLPERQTERLT